MKILIVNDLLQGGGVEKLMYDLVMAYHKKYEITVFTDKMDKDFSKIYPDDVHYMYQMEQDYPAPKNRIERKLISRKRWKHEEKLKEQMDAMKFDILLCMKESWIMMMAMKYGSKASKKIAWVHTDYGQSYYTKSWFGSESNEVNYMKRFDKVVCVSEVIKKSIIEVIGDPGNLIVQYNPLNAAQILKKSEAPVVDISKRERPLFVTVGRLNLQKGYDILLEVCNLLNAQGYKYDVWIIGGGESWNNYGVLHDLENQIFKYHLDNVYLLGHRDNPYPYIKAADVFLSSSRYEGYSYVSQEAAIINKPLLLTDCSGVSELSDDAGGVYCVENSYKGLYLGMIEAITDSGFVDKCMESRQIKRPEYYWEDRINSIEKLMLE